MASPGHLLVALLSRDAAEKELTACIPLYSDNYYIRLKARIEYLVETYEPLKSSSTILSIKQIIQDIESEFKGCDRKTQLNTIGPYNAPPLAAALEKLSNELHTIKVNQVFKEYGIEAPEEIAILECLVRVFRQKSPVLSKTHHIPNQVMDYEQCHEHFAAEGSHALTHFYHRINVARWSVATLLYCRKWPDVSLARALQYHGSQPCGPVTRQIFEACRPQFAKPFRFLDLPAELRLKVYNVLLPNQVSKASKVRCALNDTTLFVKMSALPGLRPVLSAECSWDYDHEHVVRLMTTCRLLHREVANVFFAQSSQEIAITDQTTSWLGSDHWHFGGQDPVHSWFSKLTSIRLTIYSTTELENMLDVKARLMMIVAELQKVEDLRELEIVLLPMPTDRTRTTPSSVCLTQVDTHLVQPLLELNSIKEVSMRFEDPPEPAQADQKDASDSKTITQGTPLAWSWRKDSAFSPHTMTALKWCLPNKASEEYWESIRDTSIVKVRIPPK